jgi:uncharacterized protein with von Willebrand factor type A (vWA) domain
LRRITELSGGRLDHGLGRDPELTPKAIRRIGERALREVFSELRKDRSGDHVARTRSERRTAA